MGLIISFQSWLDTSKECEHCSLTHTITQTHCSHGLSALPTAQPRPKAIFPRKSANRSEPYLRQAVQAAKRHTLIDIWIAICNWKNSFFENWHSASHPLMWGCVDLKPNQSFLPCVVSVITGSASYYLRPWLPDPDTESSDNIVNSMLRRSVLPPGRPLLHFGGYCSLNRLPSSDTISTAKLCA